MNNIFQKAIEDGKRAAQRGYLWGDNLSKQTVWRMRRQGVFSAEVIVQRWRPSPLWRLARWWRRLTGQRRSV